MFSKNLTKHLRGFSSGFTALHAKLVADAFLDFAICHRQKHNEKWRKHSYKNNSCSWRYVTWQADAIRSVTLAPPLISPHGGSYSNNSYGTVQ
jgi:hypothetical protein